jgi:hypothetical protein
VVTRPALLLAGLLHDLSDGAFGQIQLVGNFDG